MLPAKALVVAHPDDEALWLSSVVASADRIVFCFGAVFAKLRKSGARQRAVAALPLSGVVNLALRESGAGPFTGRIDLDATPSGIGLSDEGARARYETNYRKLVTSLRSTLAGAGHVYTHNPWGEYGHAEHVQVFRAVSALQEDLGYTVWFSNYVGSRSWRLATKLSKDLQWSERRPCRPDFVTAKRLMRLYRHYGAWTWTPAHRWPACETFYALPPPWDPRPRWPLSGERLLDVAGLRWWPPPWRCAYRRLPHA